MISFIHTCSNNLSVMSNTKNTTANNTMTNRTMTMNSRSNSNSSMISFIHTCSNNLSVMSNHSRVTGVRSVGLLTNSGNCFMTVFNSGDVYHSVTNSPGHLPGGGVRNLLHLLSGT